ncbi:hypothetical protein QMM95_16890 [Leptospira santarosai]|nr:hypothetical protein [Leptospira santarosai]MDI7226657.1 hypothetical protein [Leptospira santarosai]MDI7237727.1 hypothetical protein [Leptospira santarosai]
MMRKLEKWESIIFTVLVIFFLDPLNAKDPKEAEIRSYAEKYMQEFTVKQPLCLDPQSKEYRDFEKTYYSENAIHYPGGAYRHYVIDTYHFGSLKKTGNEYWLEIVFDVKGFLKNRKIIKLKEKQKRYLGFIYENSKLKLSSEYAGFFFTEHCVALQDAEIRERERKQSESLKN